MDDQNKSQQTTRVVRNSRSCGANRPPWQPGIKSGSTIWRDPRQAVLRYTIAKSCSMGAVVVDHAETVLRGCPMNVREFRKNVLPLLSTAANLFKQGARCAQIDREYDQTTEKNGDSLPLLPGGRSGELDVGTYFVPTRGAGMNSVASGARDQPGIACAV